MTQVMYDTSLASLKHSNRLKYKLADVSAGKLSTPETWARDTGKSATVFLPLTLPNAISNFQNSFADRLSGKLLAKR